MRMCHYCVLVWMGKSDSKNATCGRGMFSHWRKNLRFQTQTETCERDLRLPGFSKIQLVVYATTRLYIIAHQ